MEMESSQLMPHVEALIFASEKPLTVQEITDLINNAFGFMEDKLTPEQIGLALDGIREKYADSVYPFEIRESGGGWQFLTKKEYHKTVAQLNGDKFNKRLSAAAMETLAIIAYKQPITKSEIEAIRGVSSDYAIQKLLEKDLVVIAGRNEELPGKPLIYVTSKSFMDYFGLNSPDELPKIKEVLAEQTVQPTVVLGEPSEEQAAEMAVTNEGELITAPITSPDPEQDIEDAEADALALIEALDQEVEAAEEEFPELREDEEAENEEGEEDSSGDDDDSPAN